MQNRFTLGLIVSVAMLASAFKTTGGDPTTTPGDPVNAVVHKLKNGMTLYLSVYKDAPRVQTMIAVRAGSKNDPPETTGLAHYLEHMLFKGTAQIGSLNWEKEKVLLQQISDLYEAHRKENDPVRRKAIYAQIDSVSQIAASYVATNEYDKMVSSLGAKGTNAFTSLEETVYINDIPSNELEKWFFLESERFRQCVLRLFHTELEAVYEEFNIGQDNDGRKVYKTLMNGLFPAHTYGTQTTIGTGEHLKNPSHVNIQQFFSTYYVPNNMAIIVAGDFNPDEVIRLAEKYFGDYQPKEVPKFTFQQQPEITAPDVRNVVGPDKQSVNIAYRLPGAGTDDALLAQIVGQMLSNGQAGLIDIDLVQKQKIGPDAGAFAWALTDYSLLWLQGSPRQGQTLDEVRALILSEVEKLKKGDFEDWLLPAVIKNLKLARIREMEDNNNRASYMLEAFVLNKDWAEYNQYMARMEKFTKQDIVAFANRHFKNNYVVVNKLEGEDTDVYKVEKPKITPVPVNTTDNSVFKKAFDGMTSPRIQPAFVEFDKVIQTTKLKNGIQVDFLRNENNPTFSLNYVVDMGKDHDKTLGLAISYLKYLGTDKYSAEELQKEFYKLGLSFDVFVGDDQSYVTLSGLEESFADGVKLFEHLLANCRPNAEALQNLVADEIKQREDAKKNKAVILRQGMLNYAMFGPKSPFTNVLSEAQLKALKPEELVQRVQQLTSYKHKVFFYGTLAQKNVLDILGQSHKVPKKLKDLPQRTEFVEQNTPSDQVVFVHFPMVQAEIMLVSRGTNQFNLDEYVYSRLYNEYFGAGLSSVVFQQIRESKALAYSASTQFTSPSLANRSHYYRGYVGTQVDKMPEAIDAMREIIDNMPVGKDQISSAHASLLRQIETERITQENVYWAAQAAAKRGFPGRDLRKDIYTRFQNATNQAAVDAVVKFQQEKIKNRKYTFLVLGDREKVNMEYLRKIGPVKELTIDQIFLAP